MGIVWLGMTIGCKSHLTVGPNLCRNYCSPIPSFVSPNWLALKTCTKIIIIIIFVSPNWFILKSLPRTMCQLLWDNIKVALLYFACQYLFASSAINIFEQENVGGHVAIGNAMLGHLILRHSLLNLAKKREGKCATIQLASPKKKSSSFFLSKCCTILMENWGMSRL